jgi:hypothetical protein
MAKKKENRGGAGRGQGRKPGIKFKEGTKVMRIPLSLVPAVESLISKSNK